MRSLSVIIATMNRSEDLKVALSSLLRQTYFPEQILIVDQSTDERSKTMVSEIQTAYPEKATRFQYVYQQEKSLVKARNRGLEMARCEVLSFLDDDVVLSDDYYEKIMRYLEDHPDIGAISGNTVIERPVFPGFSGFLRRGLMRLFLIGNFDGRMTASGFGYPIIERQIKRVLEVEMLPGCNMSFRRGMIGDEQFDEWFTGYSYREDAEYSYRVAKRCRVVMIPDAHLHHNYSLSNRLEADTLKTMQIRNYYYVFHKHKHRSSFSLCFFLYSLSGILLIDLMEYLGGFQKNKFLKLSAGVRSAFAILGDPHGYAK